MILGVDHIALSAAEIEEAVRELEALGFSWTFRDLVVPNHRAKRPFVQQFATTHAVAYCSSRTPGVAIEVTVHGPLRSVGATRGYGVLLSGLSPTAQEMGSEILDHPLGVWWHRVGKGCVREVRSLGLRATWWMEVPAGLYTDTGVRVTGVMVSVKELGQSLAFWSKGLGLAAKRGVIDRPRWQLLSLSTPMPQWALDVFLVETDDAEPCWYLDDPGFPCVAFLSTDIEADRDRLQRHGATEAGEVFDVNVSGRPLQVCVLRGPSGEPVELIQVTRRRQANGRHQRAATYH